MLPYHVWYRWKAIEQVNTITNELLLLYLYRIIHGNKTSKNPASQNIINLENMLMTSCAMSITLCNFFLIFYSQKPIQEICILNQCSEAKYGYSKCQTSLTLETIFVKSDENLLTWKRSKENNFKEKDWRNLLNPFGLGPWEIGLFSLVWVQNFSLKGKGLDKA